jgi:hypothetical protein
MATKIEYYQSAITKLFKHGIDILHNSRELKGISSELKLLAINGIVHAAKNNNNEGRSLITLSGFLSDLPLKIAPEIDELELKTSILSAELTSCSMLIKRLNQFSIVIFESMLLHSETKYHHDIRSLDFLDNKTLEKVLTLPFMKNMKQIQKNNIKIVASKNIILIENLIKSFASINNNMNSIKISIERASRNGLIAQYMGSNILIEASYLHGDKSNFTSLVDNIKSLVSNLDNKLNTISDKLSLSVSIISTLIKK